MRRRQVLEHARIWRSTGEDLGRASADDVVLMVAIEAPIRR